MDVDLSEFLWETCVERPKFNAKAAHALLTEVGLMESVQLWSVGRVITTVTGSVSEFYIDTPFSCIKDIDVMHHANTMILIPAGGKIPTHLPPEYSDKVTLCAIIDSEYTGYVYVDIRQDLVLVKCQKTNREEAAVHHGLCKYQAHMTGHHGIHLFPNGIGLQKDDMSGPAQQGSCWLKGDPAGRYYEPLLKTEWVSCLHCLVWPLQATDWPRRLRNHGWPNEATIELVVNGGCDVVAVPHRKTSGNKFQFRLSFSRAETVLLNSCTKSQQIVYHVLRYIVKTERLADIRDSSGKKIFSGYHIKTLLLWACELKPCDWWADHQQLLVLCRTLLKDLVRWLRTGDVQHYFVKGWKLSPEDNSEVESVQNKTIICRLQAVIDNLPQWFYDNYIRRYAGRTSNPDILHRVNAAMTVYEKRNTLRELVRFRNNYLRSLTTAYAEHTAIVGSVLTALVSRFTTVQSCSYLVRQLAKIDVQLLFLLYGVLFAYIVDDFQSEFVTVNANFDILYTALISSDFSRVDVDAIENRSVCNVFRKASVMLKTAAVKSTLVVSVTRIKMEMAKAFLHIVLECDNSDVSVRALRCISHVYLAALYHVTGHHQTTIDHCNIVTAADNHSQCSSHVVERSLLPHIDDDIDNVCGLVVLCEFIKTAALNQQQMSRHSAAFTTELFACYLQLTVQSAVDKQPSDVLLRTLKVYCNLLVVVPTVSEPFVTDILLYRLYLVKHDAMIRNVLRSDRTHVCGILPKRCPPFNSIELCDALRQSTVACITEFRSFELRKFEFYRGPNDTDFSAMISLFCGDYERCLMICRWELATVSPGIFSTGIQLSNEYLVLLRSSLLVRALGLINIYRYTSLLNAGQLRKMNPLRTVSRLTLLFFLYAESQMKLRLTDASFIETLDIVKVCHEFVLKHRHMDVTPTSEPVFDAVLISFMYRKIQRYVQNRPPSRSRPLPSRICCISTASQPKQLWLNRNVAVIFS